MKTNCRMSNDLQIPNLVQFRTTSSKRKKSQIKLIEREFELVILSSVVYTIVYLFLDKSCIVVNLKIRLSRESLLFQESRSHTSEKFLRPPTQT